MRATALLVLALAAVWAVSTLGIAAAGAQEESGTSVEPGGGQMDLGVWIEVDIPRATEPEAGPGDPSTLPCYFLMGTHTELRAWLEIDYMVAPDPDETYIFKICDTEGGVELVTFWVFQPSPPPEPAPPTVEETTRLRNEAWGWLAIPEPTTQTAPWEITIVHLPTYVWVPAADRTSVTETVTVTLDGHEMSLTATATPRRRGFLRVDMGDGTTLWCDSGDVVAFNHSRDPLDQPSGCFHYYRQSSVNQPNLRYQVALTAYWEVSVVCQFNGGPCSNPPPAVPTQALTAPLHPIAVAEIQALASPG